MLPWCETLGDWGAVFTDVAVFEAAVRDIMGRAGLKCGRVDAGYPGSNAVFIVDGAYVVKIACPLFLEGLNIERSVLARLGDPLYPALIAQGTYEDGHAWPYFIMEYKPGEALRDVYGGLTRRQLAAIVSRLARAMRGIRYLGGVEYLPSFWERSARNIERNTESLQAAGVAQDVIRAWTYGFEWSVSEPLVLVHGDLTEDHLLIEDGVLTGVIDFADAAIAPRAYELAALYFGALRMDMSLLHLFMSVYGLPNHAGFYEEQAAILMRHDCGAGILLDALGKRGMEPGAARGIEEIKALYT